MPKSAPLILRIEYLPLSDLLRWPNNPKLHADDVITASIARFGFRDPIEIDETSQRIVSGHGRLDALERAFEAGEPPPKYIHVGDDGLWQVPVTRGGAFDNEQEASAYLVAVNKAGELGGWDESALAELLEGLDEELRGLTGFDVDVLKDLDVLTDIELQASAGPTPTPDAFTEYDDSIQTEHACPKCGYEWSGKRR